MYYESEPDVDYLPRRVRRGRCPECWQSAGFHTTGCPEFVDDDDVEVADED
jgi:hypothetical protein